LLIVVNGITEYQQALSAWEKRTVVNPLEVSLGPRDTHYVVVQLEDEPTIVESSAYIASKHFKNSTLIQMDENGDYQIVHGSKLHEIKADNIKILFVNTPFFQSNCNLSTKIIAWITSFYSDCVNAIKMGRGSADWYATHGTFGYSDLVSDLSSSFNANVLAYSPSGPNRGSYAYRYEHSEYTRVGGIVTR
jgi:hypothetical protein